MHRSLSKTFFTLLASLNDCYIGALLPVARERRALERKASETAKV
jgi:hypothetical protein